MTALVLRILEAPSAADEALLRDFADRHAVVFYLQPQGPATAFRFHPPAGPRLSYLLPDFAIEHYFSPTEFTQVNPAINRVLVRRALSLLAPQAGERIADMFCGLGNFTLPIARSGARVIGVEGSRPNSFAARPTTPSPMASPVFAEYRVADLFAATPETLAALGHFDKMLIDPPREGALELIKAID
jgi:23S rRNA (uracil1939-C5)-methyltransferase